MFWILLAAQLSAPIPANRHVPDVRALFSVSDFPEYLVRARVSRIVYTRTIVQDDGSVQSCTAEIPSGDAKLDAYTCRLIVNRAKKFLPARWIDGSPTYGVLRFPINWTITESIPSEEDMLRSTVPDLELSVNQLPKGAHKIVGVTLEIGADEKGHIVSCVEFPALAKDRRRHFPELIPIACEQAMRRLSVRPPLDPSNKPLRSVQTASVHFKLDH